MSEGDRGVDSLTGQQDRQGQTHQHRSTDHHGATTRSRDVVALEKTQHAERRAPHQARKTPHEASHRFGREPVDVFVAGDQTKHSFLVVARIVASRQRTLHKDSVHRGVGRQPPDHVLHLRLTSRCGQDLVATLQTGLGRLDVLVADVPLARPVVTHENRGQAHRWRSGSGDVGGQAGHDLVTQTISVEDDGTPGGAGGIRGGHGVMLRGRSRA